MNFKGLLKRLEPVFQKMTGRLPWSPWSPVLERLDPRTLSAHRPPMDIQEVESDGEFKKLRFGGKHEVWFPKDVPASEEVWSEYLGVFWPNRSNGHYYLAQGTGITSGDVCIDCGACEGFFALQALEQGASKVVCLEPNQSMAACLRKTFAKEISEGRLVVQNVAAGAVEGEAHFSFDCIEPFGGRVASVGETIAVSVTTITKLVSDLGLERVSYIKMDIEGAEIQAVEGAMPVLKKHHPKLAITTYHRSFDYQALHALISAAGYRHISAAGLTERDEAVYRPMMLHAV